MRCIVTLALLLAASSVAQANPADSVVQRESRYVFSVRSGMALCDFCQIDGPAVGYFTTVHGVRLTPAIRLGLGVGLTSAAESIIVPLFGSFKLNLFGTNIPDNKVFLEVNYGFAPSVLGSVSDEFGTESVHAKSYFQPSLGYSIKYHDLRLGIMLGAQAMRISSTYTYANPWGVWDWNLNKQGSPNTNEFKYNVTRLVLGISVGWRD